MTIKFSQLIRSQTTFFPPFHFLTLSFTCLFINELKKTIWKHVFNEAIIKFHDNCLPL